MAVKRYNGTSWDTVAGKGEQGTSSSITTWVKTAAGGETSLTGSSDSSTTLAYTPGQEQFFINGVLQVRGSDYTATNGTSITGISALIAGDVATVTTVNAFSVTGAVPLSTVTANGDLIVGTSSGAVGRLGVGSTGQLLTVAGGVPTWAAAPSTSTKGCFISANQGTSLVTATLTAVTFGAADIFDTDAYHNPSTNNSRITIPAGLGGNYIIYGQTSWPNFSGNKRLTFRKNGTTNLVVQDSGSVDITTLSNKIVANLVAGDYIEMVIRQSSGANQSYYGDDSGYTLATNFGITYLGA
jgi:hypothetical protein